jgi:hypothetical protein
MVAPSTPEVPVTARRLPKFLAAVLAPSTIYVIACGPGGGTKIDSGIHIVPDSPTGSGTPDAPNGSGACTADGTYAPPAFGSNNSQATNYPADQTMMAPHEQVLIGPMNGDPDALAVFLFAGFGGFGSGDIANGTYTITGDDAAWSTCGICLVVATNIGSDGSVTDYYTANSGTLTLTSVTGHLAGSISNASFIHVAAGSNSQPSDPPAVDSCTTSVSSASFNTPLMAGSATFSEQNSFVSGAMLTHRHR